MIEDTAAGTWHTTKTPPKDGTFILAIHRRLPMVIQYRESLNHHHDNVKHWYFSRDNWFDEDPEIWAYIYMPM